MLKWFRRRLAEWRAQQQAWAGLEEADESGRCRFQVQCEEAITGALEKAGVVLVNRTIEGRYKRKPGLIKADVKGTPWTLWIHPFAAGLSAPGATLVRMDSFDYDSPQVFIDTFVASVMSEIQKNSQAPGKE